MCYQVLKEAAVLIVKWALHHIAFVDRNVIDHCSPMLVLVYALVLFGLCLFDK